MFRLISIFSAHSASLVRWKRENSPVCPTLGRYDVILRISVLRDMRDRRQAARSPLVPSGRRQRSPIASGARQQLRQALECAGSSEMIMKAQCPEQPESRGGESRCRREHRGHLGLAHDPELLLPSSPIPPCRSGGGTGAGSGSGGVPARTSRGGAGRDRFTCSPSSSFRWNLSPVRTVDWRPRKAQVKLWVTGANSIRANLSRYGRAIRVVFV